MGIISRYWVLPNFANVVERWTLLFMEMHESTFRIVEMELPLITPVYNLSRHSCTNYDSQIRS